MSEVLPKIALLLSALFIAFCIGFGVAHFQLFPYSHVKSAVRTLQALQDNIAPSDGRNIGEVLGAKFGYREMGERWSPRDANASRLPVLANGGLNQFLEVCPKNGCLAVVYDSEGNIARAWPYRPDEIFAVDATSGAFPHEMPGSDLANSVRPIGVGVYKDGDLLVTFQSRGSVFPFSMGVARIAPDGSARWFRFDYSHHWAHLDEDDVAYVPALRVGKDSVQLGFEGHLRNVDVTLPCKTGQPQLDTVQLLDPGGEVIRTIDLVDLFKAPPWTGLLRASTDFCDPLHLNYVHRVGSDAGPGLSPGDIVLSLRNISRFAILDRQTWTLKRVVAGSFVHQHAVHHVAGSRFVMFDNMGGSPAGPATRILEVDVETGQERLIFPNETSPDEFQDLFSETAGNLHLSADRSRLLASFTEEGLAFEIDYPTGKLLASYRHRHDLRQLNRTPEGEPSAALFRIFTLRYVDTDKTLLEAKKQ